MILATNLMSTIATLINDDMTVGYRFSKWINTIYQSHYGTPRKMYKG